MATVELLDEIEGQARGKVYTETMVGMAAFFAGPLAAAYLLIENYKVLGQKEKVTRTWIGGIIGTIGVLGLSYVLGEIIGRGASIGFCILTMAVARWVYQKEQEKAVTRHIEKGGTFQSAWRAAGISALIFFGSLVVFLGPILIISEPVEPSIEQVVESPTIAPTITMDIQTKSYGEAAHVIVYDGADLEESMVDNIANILTQINFFDANNQKIITIERGDLGNYIFSVEDDNALLEDQANTALYEQTKEELQSFFLNRNVELLLVDGNSSEVLASF